MHSKRLNVFILPIKMQLLNIALLLISPILANSKTPYVLEITLYGQSSVKPKISDNCISIDDFKDSWGKSFDKMCKKEGDNAFHCVLPGIGDTYAIKFLNRDSCKSVQYILMKMRSEMNN